MPEADPAWVKSTLVEDALAPVAEKGKIPDVAGTERVIEEILTAWDRKRADGYGKATEKADSVPDDDREELSRARFEARKKTATTYEQAKGAIVRNPKVAGRVLTEKDLSSGVLGAITERIRLIRQGYPELHHRLKGYVISLNSPNPERRNQAVEVMYRLLDETDKIVGYSWRSPAPSKIITSG